MQRNKNNALSKMILTNKLSKPIKSKYGEAVRALNNDESTKFIPAVSQPQAPRGTFNYYIHTELSNPDQITEEWQDFGAPKIWEN